MATGLMLNADGIKGNLIGSCADHAEQAGFDEIWVPEIFGREPFVSAAVLLGGSRTIRVGTAIANVYVRDAMATKAAAETLRDIYGDRFDLGLGVSNVVGNKMRGHIWQPPVTKLEEYFDAMENWRLGFKVEGQAPVYLAAHGPKLLEFAARRSQGAFMYLTTSQYMTEASKILADKALLAMQPCVVADDLQAARDKARKAVGIYTELPNYQRAWRAQGFNDSDYRAGPSDALLDALVALGPIQRVVDKLQERLAAGATDLILIPLNFGQDRAPDWDTLADILATV